MQIRDETGLRDFAARMECIPRFLATLNKRLGFPLSHDELGDLAQDACILVMTSLPRYEGRASLDTWAWHVCRGAILNSVRSMQRRPKMQALNVDVPKDEQELLIESEELHGALEDLGPPESDVIRLKLEDRMLFSDIGTRLGISPNTAKTQYYRGIRWLQNRLSPRYRETTS